MFLRCGDACLFSISISLLHFVTVSTGPTSSASFHRGGGRGGAMMKADVAVDWRLTTGLKGQHEYIAVVGSSVWLFYFVLLSCTHQL
mmetsp:Transcript_512/g.865  ORF Transcript_512/g.865 Transcript_512/m.865 type:complete len:87 (-) Transcript_512:84-344(-)